MNGVLFSSDETPGVSRAEPAPDVSIVVPVNAQGDLENVACLLSDIQRYDGKRSVETLLVVNNYPEDCPPEEAIGRLRGLGPKVIAIPNTRTPGEAPGFSARIPGIRESRSECVILLDADCRIPHPTPLVDWYMERFEEGYAAAYTHVDYYQLRPLLAIKLRLIVHNFSRWVKRRLLGIPTTRGSNYAVKRSPMLALYDEGLLADEMNVGPVFKARVGPVAYSSSRELWVMTSGRMFRGRWRSLPRYFWYRFRYNLRVLPIREGVARRTGREKDPVRRYVDNKPVR